MSEENDRDDYAIMQTIRAKEKQHDEELAILLKRKADDKLFFSKNKSESEEKAYIINRFREEGYKVLIGSIGKNMPLFIIKKGEFKKDGFNLKRLFDDLL